jgi:hypothetical protein
VPAALLLALLAGVCDFVPVLGFVVSSIPAILLALTVSTGTAIATAAVYLGYHLRVSELPLTHQPAVMRSRERPRVRSTTPTGN